MSKEKRQKRFLQKDRHIEHQLDIAKTFNHGYYNDNNKHRLHKVNAFHCSCWMCGNPRKYHNEKTWQERKFECQAVEQTNRDSIGKWEWEDLNDPDMEWNG
jgi:hypothetical protein